jgi:hypothetical protein
MRLGNCPSQFTAILTISCKKIILMADKRDRWIKWWQIMRIHCIYVKLGTNTIKLSKY